MTNQTNYSLEEAMRAVESGGASLTELYEIAGKSPYPEVRRSAVYRITDERMLAELASVEEDSAVFGAAVEGIGSNVLLESVANRAWDEYASRLAVRKITNDAILSRIARNHISTGVRIEAVKQLKNQDLLLDAAFSNSDAEVRAAAAARIANQNTVFEIACREADPLVYGAALRTLTDYRLLARFAADHRGTNKSAAALYRLAELGRQTKLDEDVVFSLAPMFKGPDHVAVLIAMAKSAGIGWHRLFDADSLDSLRIALRTSDVHQTPMLEEAIFALYRQREELRDPMRSLDWLTPLQDDALPQYRDTAHLRRLVFN